MHGGILAQLCGATRMARELATSADSIRSAVDAWVQGLHSGIAACAKGQQAACNDAVKKAGQRQQSLSGLTDGVVNAFRALDPTGEGSVSRDRLVAAVCALNLPAFVVDMFLLDTASSSELIDVVEFLQWVYSDRQGVPLHEPQAHGLGGVALDVKALGLLTAASRELLQVVSAAAAAVQETVSYLVTDSLPSSRSGYLLTLEELLPMPHKGTSWLEEELPAMLLEYAQLHGKDAVAMQGQWTPEAYKESWGDYLADMQRNHGWDEQDALIVELLTWSHFVGPMGRALRERDPCYAGATHALHDILVKRSQRSSERAPPLYWHLHGPGSLSERDPAWSRIEDADRTGFRGIVCASAVRASFDSRRVHEAGFRENSFEGIYSSMDSDIVRFDSSIADEQGICHSAAMINSHSGLFPPNTLFKLKRVESAPFVAMDHTGRNVVVNQRCLVVTATFYSGGSPRALGGSGKMLAPSRTLAYGNREAYITGLQQIIQKPVLDMHAEFRRAFEWTDWKGARYSLRECWDYVSGRARRQEGCTPGTRDANNDGMLPEDFQSRINEHIRCRRERGYGVELAEEYAELSLLEVKAVRLYSGPAFQPINDFLRQVAALSGAFKDAIVGHHTLSLAATVGHLCHAVRKLAAVATEEEARRPLFRGVRGCLPKSFWVPEAGMVCVTDCAFMSTSRNRHTPIHYMGLGENVLWQLAPRQPSDHAFHCGADIAALSQFTSEDEVLFPPYTLLVAKRTPSPSDSAPQDAHTFGDVEASEESHEGKSFLAINVVPHFS